jgi:Zn-dependent membrane protease YugP
MDLQKVSKAIAGALVTALVSYLTAKGIVLNEELVGAVSVLVAAAIGFVAVYFAPKNK